MRLTLIRRVNETGGTASIATKFTLRCLPTGRIQSNHHSRLDLHHGDRECGNHPLHKLHAEKAEETTAKAVVFLIPGKNEALFRGVRIPAIFKDSLFRPVGAAAADHCIMRTADMHAVRAATERLVVCTPGNAAGDTRTADDTKFGVRAAPGQPGS